MLQTKKTFKIGEYAIGGIIHVDIQAALITISARDWDTKKTIRCESYSKTQGGDISDFLQELTSFYYAEKVFDWIKSKVDIQY